MRERNPAKMLIATTKEIEMREHWIPKPFKMNVCLIP
jgi:hypothetical protein